MLQKPSDEIESLKYNFWITKSFYTRDEPTFFRSTKLIYREANEL